MLALRLTTNQATQAGTLTITCAQGGLAELINLAEELGHRSTIEVEGAIHTLNEPPGITED